MMITTIVIISLLMVTSLLPYNEQHPPGEKEDRGQGRVVWLIIITVITIVIITNNNFSLSVWWAASTWGDRRPGSGPSGVARPLGAKTQHGTLLLLWLAYNKYTIIHWLLWVWSVQAHLAWVESPMLLYTCLIASKSHSCDSEYTLYAAIML